MIDFALAPNDNKRHRLKSTWCFETNVFEAYIEFFFQNKQKMQKKL